MTLKLTCPTCAAVFALAEDPRGKKAFCPRCGQALIVTSSGVAKWNERQDWSLEPEAAAIRAGAAKGTEQSQPVPAPPAPARPWGLLLLLLLALPLLFFCLLLSGGLTVYLFMPRGHLHEPQSVVVKPDDVADSRKGGDNKEEVKDRNLVVDLGNGVKMEFVRIPAGEFLMGSPDSDKDAQDNEKPQHPVKITKDFYLGKYPVTQEQHQAVMGKNPSTFSSERPNNGLQGIDTRRFPVESASWDDASEFCAALKRLDKQQRAFHLPTEAQWEYAARAGTSTRYSFGNSSANLPVYGWFEENAVEKTHEVGTRKPNAWGLYDMHGNVWEWCADRLTPSLFGKYEYYAKSPKEDPKGPDSGAYRVLRGGSWNDPPLNCRAASRFWGGGKNPFGLESLPTLRDNRIGFRVCIRLDAE